MKSLFVIFLILGVSCSVRDTRKNFTHGDVSFVGGSYQEINWEESMNFKRYSWFSEASLRYDILLHRIDPSSKFVQWLERDKSLLENCNHLYIALFYSARNTDFKPTYFASQFEKVGYESLKLMDFDGFLKAHPAYQDWRLFAHKSYGFCKKDLNTNPVKIKIPGYAPQKVN